MGKPNKPVVLVVEDEDLTRMDAVEIISEAGFEAIEASNADDAIAILERRNDIRVIITDVNMPGSIDGVRLAHVVRDRWPPVEIIVVSALSQANRALPERSVFLQKPYAQDQITNCIRSFVP